MSEPSERIGLEIKDHDGFMTIACDDLSLFMGREVTTIDFYIDRQFPQFIGTGKRMDLQKEVRHVRMSVKIPTSKLFAILQILPNGAKALLQNPDYETVFLQVFSKGNLSRKKARSRTDSVVTTDFKTIERSVQELERKNAEST